MKNSKAVPWLKSHEERVLSKLREHHYFPKFAPKRSTQKQAKKDTKND